MSESIHKASEPPRTAVLACPTLRDEMGLAEQHVRSGYDFYWLDESYHNFPDMLKVQIQQHLDALDICCEPDAHAEPDAHDAHAEPDARAESDARAEPDAHAELDARAKPDAHDARAESDAHDAHGKYGRVLLGFGFCGNAVQGLRAGGFELVVPRIDDCISMMLGSMSKRAAIESNSAGIYLTRGWLEGPKGSWAEYEHMLKRLGSEDAREALQLAYGNYRQLYVIDTGAYDMKDVLERATVLADVYGMKQKVVQGTVAKLEMLLSGPWGKKDYVIVPPHGVLSVPMPTPAMQG